MSKVRRTLPHPLRHVHSRGKANPLARRHGRREAGAAAAAGPRRPRPRTLQDLDVAGPPQARLAAQWGDGARVERP
jgi:hypothetical protein